MQEEKDEELITGKYTDHDLLIVLHTKMSRVMFDISNIGKDVSGQIKELQLMKHDKEAAMAMKTESDKIHSDHEKRLRRVERWGFTAIGALALIELIMKSHGG